jgi:large subunit ribosomal protein L10
VPTPKKVATVKELAGVLGRSKLTIVSDYRGLTVADLQHLRAQLRPHNAEVRIAKNTLTVIAARETSLDALEPQLVGPTALVTAFDDPVQPAKIVSDFARVSRILQIRAAMLEGQLISAAEVESLATLPGRDVLIGRVVGGLTSPLYGIVGVLAAPIRSLQYVLQARVQQLGGADDGAAGVPAAV